MSNPIVQTINYAASPEAILDVLTDAKKFSAISGDAPTEIDSAQGGAFSCFGGMISGRTIESVPGKRLVQAWRVKLWDEGDFSVVRIDVEKTPEGSKLTLTHSAYPDGQEQNLADGWHSNYWEPIRGAVEA